MSISLLREEIPDPKFCPGTDPGFGSAGCYPPQLTFNDAYNDAITYSGLAPPGWTGTVYFETGTHSGTFDIDGADFSLIPSLFTIMSVGNSSDTVLSDTVKIDNMNAVTLQGFSISAADPDAGIIVGNGTPITGTLTLTDVIVTNTVGSGITIVQNNGDVVFNSVQANSNFGTGAAITNTTGSGNVTVDSSTFNANINGGDGLRIDHSAVTTTVTVSSSTFGDTSDTGNVSGTGLKIMSKGDITLTDVTASFNATGVYIDNSFGAGSVTVNGTNVFNNNDSGSTGLHVVSNGDISVSGVTANNNPNSNGAYLESTGGSVTVDSSTFESNDIKGLHATTLGSGNVTVTNVTTNSNGLGPYPDGDGVRVEASGIVSVDGVTANGNGAKGAVIDNSVVTATVTVSNSTFGASGVGNVEKGLYVTSNSDVTLTDVTASYNTLQGAYIANNSGMGDVTITGTNIFSDSAMSSGLEAYTNGIFSASGVTANSNGTNGVYIDNSTGSGSVTLTNVTADNNGDDSTGNGVTVVSTGNVSLSGVSASTNIAGYGASLDNSIGSGNVTVVNGSFNSNYESGLFVSGSGDVTLTNVSAITNTASSGQGGLYAQTFGIGNITLTDVSVNNSSGPYGAYLTNDTGGSTGSITLNGTNTFNNNSGGDGLHIEANGAVSVGGVTANGNGTYGAYLKNSIGPAPAAVTVSNSTFGATAGAGNGVTGLYVESQGNVTLSGVTASYNTSSEGAYISNTSGAGDVTINGTNTFNNNGNGGVVVASKGVINASGITANNNGATGAYFDNATGFANPTVTVSNSTFGGELGTGNALTGLDILSDGDVTLIDVTASYNVLDGVNITSNGGIVFIDPSYFNGNGGSGLSINSGAGNITLDCVTSSGNGSPDVITTSGTVTVSCSSSPPTVIIIVGDSPSDGGETTRIIDTLTDFAAFKTPDGIVFYSYGFGGAGVFMIFVPDAIWKNAKPGEVIVNCLDSRGYNLRFSRLSDDRISLFGLGSTAPNEGWFLLRWFAPDGRLVNRVYVRLKFG